MTLAAGLGSDVPFFLQGGTALGLGRGEELYPVDDVGRLGVVVIKPSFGVNTGEAYRWLAEDRAAGVAAPPSVDVAAHELAEAFAVWMDRWEALGFQPVLDAWRARTPGLDGPAVARLGHETVEGRAEGVEPDGALRLRLADGSLRLISAGDVFFGEGG